jgi:hypothetical protein
LRSADPGGGNAVPPCGQEAAAAATPLDLPAAAAALLALSAAAATEPPAEVLHAGDEEGSSCTPGWEAEAQRETCPAVKRKAVGDERSEEGA